MRSSKCFVPGCKTGYESEKEKRKAEGKKYPSLFSVPREEDKLEKWRNAVPKSKREMNIGDKVCELHFLPSEITKSYVIRLPDGTDKVCERKYAMLNSDAVPSLLLDIPLCFNKKKKKSSPCKRLTVAKKAKISSPTDEFLDMGAIEVLTVDFGTINSITETVTEFSFSDLLTNVDYVFKPNKWWAISSHIDFVVCVKWDIQFASERQVIIDNNLSVKVMYYGTEVTVVSDKVVQSIEHLSAILAKINGYPVCTGFKQGYKNCSVFMESQQASRGRPQKLCASCKKNIAITPRKQRDPILALKYQSYYQRIAHANEKTARLRENIAVLKKKVALLRGKKTYFKTKSMATDILTTNLSTVGHIHDIDLLEIENVVNNVDMEEEYEDDAIFM